MITVGTFGMPLAIPLERTGLEVGQLLFATTDTVDPPGMLAGKRIEHEVVVPVTTAPTTDVVQV